MNKIKITVAALLLGSMSYAQCVSTSDLYCSCDSLSAEQIADIEGIATSNTYKAQWAYIESRATIEDVIEWMHSDIQDGRVEEEVGELYIQNLIDLLSKLEDINAGLITN